MSEPTPGPWKARKSPHGPRYLCVQIGKDEAYTTLELEPADARLMAAAPEMLAALRAVLNSDMAMREEDEGRVSEVLNEVRKAIAKAGARRETVSA
jgi:hypothetical protein